MSAAARGRGTDASRSRRRTGRSPIVDGIDFAVEPGEIFGVAGESGSGKTMTTLALLRPAAARARRSTGRRDLRRHATCCSSAAARCASVRGSELAMVFQDPMTSLHPMLSIERQLTDHLRSHLGLRRKARATRARSSCSTTCGIPDPERALHVVSRTSSPAACASASRSPSRSPASRRC